MKAHHTPTWKISRVSMLLFFIYFSCVIRTDMFILILVVTTGIYVLNEHINRVAKSIMNNVLPADSHLKLYMYKKNCTQSILLLSYSI